ncbi:hypothetical protein RchiOBHm_Chr3g0496171 [Rosa chinensis]|uniref:Uncharacterized protein n=1 Tax=Rosa chinensis TaxID=74649 RepID=A0A2P6RHG1_ROSCH|nr:hypothetical protein RchiOBHm_Chr3g0496171 [Rosa chinensis]
MTAPANSSTTNCLNWTQGRWSRADLGAASRGDRVLFFFFSFLFWCFNVDFFFRLRSMTYSSSHFILFLDKMRAEGRERKKKAKKNYWRVIKVY